MKKLFMSRHFHIAIAIAVIGFIVFMVVNVRNSQQVEYVTTIVERGDVERLVSVSGIIEAKQSVDLAFPTTGIVSAVSVAKGDTVEAGSVLVTLEARALQADRQDAVAVLSRAVATRDELVAGPQSEARAATKETVALKISSLETIKATQADLVANAYRTLLSSGLTAASDDPDENAVAPIVSGAYSCQEEGTYQIETYNSSANSGYSYQLSGLESGIYNASTGQPSALGTCGLRVLFDDDSQYSSTLWTIDIPNKQSPVYITNRNTYSLAITQASSAIALAEGDVALAQANASNTNAPARSESITRANADIASANARIARIDAKLADRTIRAPFSGTIVDLDVQPGETVTTAPVVTLLATADFELTARIPEIDIGKLETGQPIRAVFDANEDQILNGTIEFISLQATKIDGVAYYEAIINLEETPTWMRSGLNADIDIITTNSSNNLRVPSRFVTENEDVYQVTTKVGEQLITTPVDIILEGNDGYIAITGINEGDIVVAP